MLRLQIETWLLASFFPVLSCMNATDVCGVGKTVRLSLDHVLALIIRAHKVGGSSSLQ